MNRINNTSLFTSMLTLAVVLLSFCTTATAQGNNPGYLGRHVVITLNGNVNMNHGFLLNDGKDLNADAMPVVFSPAITLEYTLNRKYSLALQAGMQTVSTRYSYIGNDNQEDPYNYIYSGSLTRTQADAKITDIMLTLRHYGGNNNGRITPLGGYFGYGLMLSHQSFDTLSDTHFHSVLGKTDFYRGGIVLEAGRNYIWMNRLAMNIGIRYTLIAGWPFNEKIFSFDDYTTEESAEKYVNATAWVTHCIMLQLGIGFLPF